MSVLERVLDYYRSTPGVIRAEPMDDELSARVLEIESGTRTQTDGEYENLAYKLTMEKQHRVCIFFTEEMQLKHHTDLMYVDDDGNVMGRMLTPEEVPEYRDRDDVIWVSKDFVMFPDCIGNGDGRFVLYPFECTELDAAAGSSRSIGASPVLPADMLMKEHWDIPRDERVFSLIIGFDG